jgi:hypothetical protein
MHAFPSKQDLENFHQQVKASNSKFSPLMIFSTLMSLFFAMARVFSFFWFDLLYAFFIAMLPIGLTGLVAR